MTSMRIDQIKHDLREIHNSVSKEFTAQWTSNGASNHEIDARYEDICSGAKALIEASGFSLDDSDMYGQEMSTLVETLLTVAFMLQPGMVDVLVQKGYIE